jgi:hypothetical protein
MMALASWHWQPTQGKGEVHVPLLYLVIGGSPPEVD